VLIEGDRLNLMFQERSRTDPRWRLGLASGRLPVGATG
jgi:hypothetical protein